MRKATIDAQLARDSDPAFTWRSESVSRVENLSDIVFGLTLALLASTSVPTNFDELTMLWREAAAAGLCFLIFLLIWRAHFVFFRRYGLEDSTVTVLNAVLLFLVIVFAYPLKFIAGFLIALIAYYAAALTGGSPDPGALQSAMSIDQAPLGLVIYSAGYGALFSVFALLYRHAYRKRVVLQLNDREVILSRAQIQQNLVHVFVAALVVIAALSLPGFYGALAGMLYFLIGPLIALVHQRINRNLAALEAT